MNVAQLIDKLKKLPQDLEVCIPDRFPGHMTPMSNVAYCHTRQVDYTAYQEVDPSKQATDVKVFIR